MVGRLIGEDALAAVGTTYSLHFLTIGFVQGALCRVCDPAGPGDRRTGRPGVPAVFLERGLAVHGAWPP